MTKPVGIWIRNPQKETYTIGDKIGSGACGSVHNLLVRDDNKKNTSSGFVAKLAPLPTKITRKKQTPPERNARLLYNEGLLYQNQFPDYQGLILPKLPSSSGPPVSGEKDGYKFLIMEKMRAPLWDVIPELLKSNSKSATIDLAPIAQQLLFIVEMIHDENHVLVDIKPENFMLAFQDAKPRDNAKGSRSSSKAKNSGNKMPSKSTETAQSLAKKLRLLDLGLVVPWRGPKGHREDEGIGEVVGTPLYCSRAVNDGHTPSRRDDIEAMGYVIAEMVIRLVAEANGEADKYEGKSDDDIPTYLPWSGEKSDEAIGSAKAREVNNSKSKFYERMGDKETAKTLEALFNLTENMKYKEKPNYEAVHDLLSKLQVAIEPKKKRASTKTTATTSRRTSPRRPTRASRAAKRSAVSDAENDSEDDRKKSPEKKQKTEDEFEDAMDVEIIDVSDDDEEDDDDEDEVFEDAMEWENEPEAKENRGVSKKGISRGVRIVVEDGPHKGESLDLISDGDIKEVTIGRNPKLERPMAGHGLWPLKNDEGIDPTHCKLSLRQPRQSKPVISVNLVDLKAEGGTWVANKQVSGSTVVFINGKFTAGTSTFRISKLPKPDKGEGKAKAVSKKAQAAKGTAAANKPLGQKKQAAAVKSKAGADILLVAVSGPHRGQSWALSSQDGGVDTITFGSEKSVVKEGHSVVLDGDADIEKQHARFVLLASKKVTKVAIVSLAKSGTYVNRKNEITESKKRMAYVGDTCKMGKTVVEIRRGN